MSNFNENTRVQVPAALHLCKLGYTYIDTSLYKYDPHTNILSDIFIASLVRINPDLGKEKARQLLNKIISITNNDDLGKEFYQMLSANSGIKLIDFDNPSNNVWHLTTEFSCGDKSADESFRPDITCFVNGLPLAFIEVKKPNNHLGIIAEKERTNSRISKPYFRRFFNITQLMIFSNNQEYDNESREPIWGAFYCCTAKEKAFFNVFREEDKDYVANYPYLPIDEQTERYILKHRNAVTIRSSAEYSTNKEVTTPTNRILTSMLSKERFLYLLRYGFAYVNQTITLPDGSKGTRLEKHVMRYQQLFASLAIQRRLEEGVKSGIIWHTQGSGKTALAYYTVKVLNDFYARKNIATKFYFIVDRIDLMEQATDEFAARGLVARNAKSREELMEDISNTALVVNSEGKLEIMVVNIQKFKEDKAKVQIADPYNTRLQRIFFIDEAHRGYNPKGSFLANLLEADTNAIKIALTGTPLLKEERASWKVFGDYINTYYYDKSIADGYTLKLMREPIETDIKQEIEKLIEEIAGEVKVKKKDFDKDKIIEHEQYLKALLNYIVEDFRKFRTEMADPTVAAMIVCKTNAQARALYSLWLRKFPKTDQTIHSEVQDYWLAAEPIPIYNTKNKPLTASLILHDEGDKQERKDYIDTFKKENNIDVLIVNQMLLTGFDAPRLKRLYLGRSLDGHDLLQALTRVNRPYKDFRYGYVVDFVDIKENFEATNDRYLRELNRTTSDTGLSSVAPIGNVIIEDPKVIQAKMLEIKRDLFSFSTHNAEEFRREIDEIEDKEQLYHLRKLLEEARAIINQVRAFGGDELKEKINIITKADNFPTLIGEVTRRIDLLNLKENRDHKADVAGIINIVLSELEFEFRKGVPEELQILVNDVKERHESVKAEFMANFDSLADEEYLSLSAIFKEYFDKKGFILKDAQDFRESIAFMEEIMKKIKEINRRNNILKKKYNQDERFTRIHKRIKEKNKEREKQKQSSIIGFVLDTDIFNNLIKMKEVIDEELFRNIYLLEDEGIFKDDVLSILANVLLENNIEPSSNDREYIRNLISDEYLRQYKNNSL